jgi:hypothetical protein
MKQLFAVLVFILSTASVAAWAGDEPTLEDKKQLLEFLMQGFADMKPSPGLVRDVPQKEPVAKDVTVAAIKKGLDLFLGTFSFWSQEGKRGLIIDSVPAHVPASQLIQAELRWSKAQAGKKTVSIKQPTSAKMVRLEKLEQTQLPDMEAKKLRRLEGTLVVRYPGRIATAELGANEVGKVKSIGDASCRLLSIDNDLVTVTCTGELSDLDIHPVSAKGVILDTQGSMTGPTLIHRQLGKDGRLPPALFEKYLGDLEQLASEGKTFVMNAQGKPVKVLILKPVEHQTETLKVVALPLPEFDAEKCPAIPSPHFALPRTLPPYARLSESQVKQATKILPERSRAMFGFNNQVIELLLPEVPNSTHATLEVKDLVLKKKGATVPYDPQGPFQDSEMGHLYTFRMDPTGGNSEPVDFDTATGKLVIHYPTRIATRKLPSPGEPGVAKIEGCEVLGYLGDHLPKESKLRPTLRAFDEEGHELALGHKFGMGGQDDHGMFFPHRYWGQVAWVEADVVEEWKDVTISFTLKPTPPRAKER